MPNLFAFAMLLAWPLAAIHIYKKYDKSTAVILLFLVPYLILPVKAEIDLPVVPVLDKTSIPALAAFLLFYFDKKTKLQILPDSTLMRRIIIMMFVFPIFTVYANTDSLAYGYRVFSGLKFMDLINIWFSHFSFYLVPFILGCQFLRSESSHKLLVSAFATAGLLYSILVIYEIRMSPQLHSDIYGYFPHSWRQQARQGGFRAVVFLGHGLLVAMFMAFTTFCVATIWKERGRLFKISSGMLLTYMFIVMVLSKSLGALVFVVSIVPVILFFSKKAQLRLTVAIAILVISYPALRTYNIIPIDQTLGFFSKIDKDRAGSLEFRFDNEDLLLEKANARSYFGWGTWGRNRVFDPVSGKDLSVTDGMWVIIFGLFGWMGYLTLFLLLVAPIFLLNSTQRNSKVNFSSYTTTLSLILAINLFDLIPNSSLNHLTVLVAGAIVGRALEVRSQKKTRLTEVNT